MGPTVMRANPDEEYYLLESRVRENRMHASVGGEDVRPSLPNQGVNQSFPQNPFHLSAEPQVNPTR